jgi:phage shock protein A
MGIFSRMFKIGQAEANSAINKLEDPIKINKITLKSLQDSVL